MSIGHSAFYNCVSLTNLTIGRSVTTLGNYVLDACDEMKEITVDANNTTYQSIDGNLYSKDGKTLIQYAIGKDATSFTIPTSVEYIADRAFHHNDSLEQVILPDSLLSIGDEAFESCVALTSINLGNKVECIGMQAFSGCEGLTTITIPRSVQVMGSDVFWSCSDLTIYCETESKPNGWHPDWDSLCDVVWAGTAE